MRFDVITLFPSMIEVLFASKIFQAAGDKKLFELHITDLRDFGEGPNKSVDDIPFGGGAGMVLRPEPLCAAMESIEKNDNQTLASVYLTPKGQSFTQQRAKAYLEKFDHLILVCGRYQGVDQRFIDTCIDEELSVGPYVLNGGETAALVVLETIIRLIPGVLGNERSLTDETHSQPTFIEAPVYTRPKTFRGHEVPEVLRSGNHTQIERFRAEQAKIYKSKSILK